VKVINTAALAVAAAVAAAFTGTAAAVLKVK